MQLGVMRGELVRKSVLLGYAHQWICKRINSGCGSASLPASGAGDEQTQEKRVLGDGVHVDDLRHDGLGSKKREWETRTSPL
jgi:hypothetical protein